jgi:hypothetical protein
MNWAAMLALQTILFAILRSARQCRGLVRTIVAAAALVLPQFQPSTCCCSLPFRYSNSWKTAWNPEVNRLTEVCAAEGVSLLPMPSGLHRQGAASVIAVGRSPSGRPALLQVSDCRVQDLDIPADAELGGISRAGALVWRPRDSARQENRPMVPHDGQRRDSEVSHPRLWTELAAASG